MDQLKQKALKMLSEKIDMENPFSVIGREASKKSAQELFVYKFMPWKTEIAQNKELLPKTSLLAS